jgi:hypothetical protein
LMRSTFATDVPPNFITRRAMDSQVRVGKSARKASGENANGVAGRAAL